MVPEPIHYLDEYYGNLDEENIWILNFIHNAHKQIHAGMSMIDLGTGPCIYQLISASKKVKRITISDINPHALELIVDNQEKNLDTWNSFIGHCLSLEKEKGDKQSIQSRKDLILRKIKSSIVLDLKKVDLQIATDFDIVQSIFVIESISHNKQELEVSLKNAVNLVKMGGNLILVCLENSNGYRVDNRLIKCHPIDNQRIRDLIRGNGLEILSYERLETKTNRGYTGLLGFVCKKPRLRRGFVLS